MIPSVGGACNPARQTYHFTYEGYLDIGMRPISALLSPVIKREDIRAVRRLRLE